jgi:hypothetical protein
MAVVLLGGGGTGTAFAIASRLRAGWNTDLRIVITDIHDAHLVTTSILADAFHKVPPANDPGFEEALADILTRESVSTYIPILNDEIRVAGKLSASGQFGGVDFWASEATAFLTDKLAADEWLRALGVRTPVSPADGISADAWFAKPRNGYGSRGTKQLTDDKRQALTDPELKELLIQEVCNPPEVTVDSFYNHETGECFAYCRERVEVKAGVCTKARIFADAELEDFARRIGRALEQKGTICFQAMQGSGGWCVTDLNLRPGAGTALTCAAGFDVISAAFACRNGEDYATYLLPRPDGDIFVTRQYSEFVMASAG